MRNYWWPGVIKDIGKYVDSCDMCQRMKNRTETPVRKLIVNEVLKKVWTHLMVDFITKLPLVAEKDTILVVCDMLLKMVHFIAITEEMTVERLARPLTTSSLFPTSYSTSSLTLLQTVVLYY